MTVVLKLDGQQSIPYGFTGIVERREGTKSWWLNGKYHREDGPAIEYADGEKGWYLNGRLHRVGGPAIEAARGHKEWHRNGFIHREDGPAVEYNSGNKSWWFEGTFVVNNSEIFNLKGNYVVLERGIPTDEMFGKLKLTHAKLLTGQGTMFVYDNLPGGEIGEGNG